MRHALWLAIPLAALLFVPVAAQNPPQSQVIEKLRLAHTDPKRLWDALTSVPAGISGMLAYPLDKSLIVRGTPAGIEEAKAALRVIDVPAQNGRLEVTLQLGNAEVVRAAALALPQAGTVQVQGKTLGFAGKEEWLYAVRGVVFGAELANPRPRPLGNQGFAPGGALPPPVPAIVEIVVPEGDKLDIQGDRLQIDAGKGETRVEGNVRLSLPNGVRIRTRDSRVLVSPLGPKGERSISIEPLVGLLAGR